MQLVEHLSPRFGYPLLLLDGDVSGIDSDSNSLSAAQTRCEELMRVCRTITGDVALMEGAAVERVTQQAADAHARLRPVRSALSNLANVVGFYSTALDEAKQRLDPLVPQIEDAIEAVSQAETHFDEASSALTGSDDDDATAVLVATRQARQIELDIARAELERLWHLYEEHFGAWSDDYERAIDQVSTALPAGGLASDGRGVPANIESLLADLVGSDPASVSAAWQALSPEERADLIEAYPEIVGNLDGVPYEVRTEVNLQVLEDANEQVFGEPIDSQIDVLLDELADGASAISVRISAADQVTAVLAYGDIATATDVNVLVPGMNTDVSQIGDWGASAIDLNELVIGRNQEAQPATLVWFGYDTPNIPEEPHMGHADEGAAQFTTFMQGLNLEVSPSAEIAAIAHSYGSTTSGEAIGSAPDHLGVDQFITLGSAGLSGGGVSGVGLNFDGVEIFATASPTDSWSLVGKITSWAHSTDPGLIPGATVFDSDSGFAEYINPSGEHTGLADPDQPLHLSPGHSTHDSSIAADWPHYLGPALANQPTAGYLQRDSESLYNVASIVANGEPWTTPDRSPEFAA